MSLAGIVAFLVNYQSIVAAVVVPAVGAFAYVRGHKALLAGLVGLVAMTVAWIVAERIAAPLGSLVAFPLVAASLALAAAYLFDRADSIVAALARLLEKPSPPAVVVPPASPVKPAPPPAPAPAPAPSAPAPATPSK